jgi:hypothetical protein
VELQGVQQFLQVPSSGIGSSQQIISIPLNLLTQGNQQSISLLTSNGQIIQIPSLQIIQTSQNNDNQQQQQQQILTTNSNTQQQQSQQQQHILINQNGQLISLPLSSFQAGGSSVGTTSTTTTTTANSNIITLPSNINLSSLNSQNTITQVQPQTVKQQQQHNTIINNNNNNNSHDQHDFKLNNNQQRNNNPGTTPIKTLLEEDDNKSEASLDDQGPTIANLPDRK